MSNPLFTTVPLPKIKRNTFKLTHRNTFTMDIQKNYPTLIMESLPGDRFITHSELMVRCMPLIAPVYQNYNISQHAFFVPMRQLSDNWEQFITGGKDGIYSDVMPYTTYADIYNFINDWKSDLLSAYDAQAWSDLLKGDLVSDEISVIVDLCDCIRLFDFAGLSFSYQSVSGQSILSADGSDDLGSVSETGFIDAWLSLNSDYSSCQVPVNLLPFVAMLKVWSEYYRDENLVDDPLEDATFLADFDFKDVVGYQDLSSWNINSFTLLFKMRPRAWKKDRFSSALPFTQRGPDVLLPIAGTAPVGFTASSVTPHSPLSAVSVTATDSGGTSSIASLNAGAGINVQGNVDFEDAELSTTINDFRRAERLQRWYEASARGGSRLNENTLAHWGVHTPDSSIQRAYFLGGNSQPLVISEVTQNSASDDTSPQGNLAGKGTSYDACRLFKHYDSEHGYFIVYTSILQNADYMQGTPKLYTRQDRYEYAWPEFANLGEEEIKTSELYTLAGKDAVFGYTPRYSEYKSMPNEIHGDMRTSLAHWAVPRKFDGTPKLNSEFIYNSPTVSPFAVESGQVDRFICTARFAIKSSRLLPFYGVPTI